MKISKLLTSVAFVGIATSAYAAEMATETNINSLPKEGMVQISGTVTEVDGANEFTLKDSTGEIEVESDTDLNLALGDEVTVSGEIDSGFFSTEIEATNVTINAMNYELETSAGTSVNTDSNLEIEDGNTKVTNPVGYEVDVDTDAEVTPAEPMNEDAKSGTIEEFNNEHSKDVDLNVDVDVDKKTDASVGVKAGM